jgi:hypothetical protein
MSDGVDVCVTTGTLPEGGILGNRLTQRTSIVFFFSLMEDCNCVSQNAKRLKDASNMPAPRWGGECSVPILLDNRHDLDSALTRTVRQRCDHCDGFCYSIGVLATGGHAVDSQWKRY